MVQVRLGNAAPVHTQRDDEGVESRTLIAIDAPWEPAEMAIHEDGLQATLATASALWRTISDAPPVWVAADDEAVEMLLASHFGCDRGEPAPRARKGAK